MEFREHVLATIEREFYEIKRYWVWILILSIVLFGFFVITIQIAFTFYLSWLAVAIWALLGFVNIGIACVIFENLFWPWYLSNVDQNDPRLNCTFEEYAGVHAEEHTTESQELCPICNGDDDDCIVRPMTPKLDMNRSIQPKEPLLEHEEILVLPTLDIDVTATPRSNLVVKTPKSNRPKPDERLLLETPVFHSRSTTRATTPSLELESTPVTTPSRKIKNRRSQMEQRTPQNVKFSEETVRSVSCTLSYKAETQSLQEEKLLRSLATPKRVEIPKRTPRRSRDSSKGRDTPSRRESTRRESRGRDRRPRRSSSRKSKSRDDSKNRRKSKSPKRSQSQSRDTSKSRGSRDSSKCRDRSKSRDRSNTRSKDRSKSRSRDHSKDSTVDEKRSKRSSTALSNHRSSMYGSFKNKDEPYILTDAPLELSFDEKKSKTPLSPRQRKDRSRQRRRRRRTLDF